MPIQRLFLALCAAEGYKIFGADVKDAYAHAPASGIKTYMSVDEAYSDWFREVLGKEVKKGSSHGSSQ